MKVRVRGAEVGVAAAAVVGVVVGAATQSAAGAAGARVVLGAAAPVARRRGQRIRHKLVALWLANLKLFKIV